jgi:Flp pilus assembly protein TadD
MDRIATFKSFIERSPTDPFPRYGLAMELRRLGRLEEARSAFAELLEGFPDYVPTYLMAGNNLVALGQRAEAITVLQRGVATATRKGDGHARNELASALADLENQVD